MSRWPRSVVVVLVGGMLFNGGCATAPPCAGPQSASTSVLPSIPAVSSSSAALEQKVKVQEKRIADLSMQLKLLKRIDLDRSKP